MKIISVAAPGNGSGKTLTLAAILQAFPERLDAVKFTTVFKDGVNCPRTETACACRTLHGDYTVVTDPEVLAAENTDTGRLTRSGASSVLWCLSMVGSHEEAWRHLRTDLLDESANVITEGNTIIPFLRPDLLIMVASPDVPRDRWKPDTADLMARADHMVLNRHGGDRQDIEALRDEIALLRGGREPIIQDVSRPLDEWADPSLKSDVGRLLSA